MSIGDWKLKLIEEILQLKEEHSLRKIEQEIKFLSEAEKKAVQLKSIFKPLRPSISIEEMKKEQGYHPIKRSTFYKKAAKLKIEEPLDEVQRFKFFYEKNLNISAPQRSIFHW